MAWTVVWCFAQRTGGPLQAADLAQGSWGVGRAEIQGKVQQSKAAIFMGLLLWRLFEMGPPHSLDLPCPASLEEAPGSRECLEGDAGGLRAGQVLARPEHTDRADLSVSSGHRKKVGFGVGRGLGGEGSRLGPVE